MANLLLITAILLHRSFHANASSTKNLGVLQSKVKDAAIATQTSISKLAMEEASNDSKSNEYLYDLLVDSITINGTKVTTKPASKSSKPPSTSPVVNPLGVTIPAQTSNAPSPYLFISGENTSVPTSNTTSSSASNSSFLNDVIFESSSSPSQALTSAFAQVQNTSNSETNNSSVASTTAPTTAKTSTTSTPFAQGSLDICPDAFDSSIEYMEFDVVSMGSVMYECKEWPRSAYCNSFEPGSEYSDHGWSVLAPCIASPTQSPSIDGDEGVTQSPSTISSGGSEPTPPVVNSSEGFSQSPNGPSPTIALAESQPPSAFMKSITFFPTSTPTIQVPSPTGSSLGLKNDDLLSVNLPRIICDISLSSNLAQSFEQKHILLLAMTNTIYNVFELHLNKDLYEIAGISLSVSVNKNLNQSATSMIRLKADFTGTASFSLRGAPSESVLIDILLRHFSIDEFTKRLIPSAITRSAASIQEPVLKVNSVFFSLENGMLIPAGTTYDAVSSSPTVTGDTLESANLQLAVGVFVLTGVGFALVMVLFFAQSKRIEFDDADETVAPDPPSDNRGNVASDNRVEITTCKKNPFLGGLDTISDVSSLSESPFTERSTKAEDIAPMTPSLGIAPPNYRYRAGVRVPYVSDVSVDYDIEGWKKRSCMLETP